MNIKKLVSAVSALTIAASTFAGLALTAQAEDYTYTFLYGSKGEDGTISAQSDFEGGAEVEKVFAGTTFITGTALDAKSGVTANFDSAVSTGKVVFSTAYTVLGGVANHINLVDNDGNNVVSLYPVDSKNSGTINNVAISGTGTNSAYVYTPRNVAYRITIELDLDANTYSGSQVLCTGGSSGTVNKVATTSFNGTIGSDVNIKGLKTLSNKNSYYMDDILLYAVQSSEQKYDAKIEYKLGDEVVKTTEASVAAGNTITSETVFTENGQKYYSVDTEAKQLTVTADGTNTLTVPVRVANNYTLSVAATGDINDTLVGDATVVEGETFNYTFPKYIVKDGVAYEAEKQNDGYYGWIGNVTADQTVNVKYNKAYEDVVFLEDLDGTSGQNAGSRASNGLANDNTAYTSSEELQPGTYTFVIRYQGKGRGSSIKVGDTTIFNYVSTDKNSWKDVTIPNVTITEASAISHVPGNDNTYDDLDTILVYKSTPNVTNIGEFEGTDGTVATAFTADVTGKTGTFKMAVTSSSGVRVFTDSTVLTDTNATIGIIIGGLKDKTATAVWTVE